MQLNYGILDLFIPTILFIILAILRYEVDGFIPEPKNAISYDTEYPLFSATLKSNSGCISNFEGATFLFTPLTKAANETMEKINKTLCPGSGLGK